MHRCDAILYIGTPFAAPNASRPVLYPRAERKRAHTICFGEGGVTLVHAVLPTPPPRRPAFTAARAHAAVPAPSPPSLPRYKSRLSGDGHTSPVRRAPGLTATCRRQPADVPASLPPPATAPSAPHRGLARARVRPRPAGVRAPVRPAHKGQPAAACGLRGQRCTDLTPAGCRPRPPPRHVSGNVQDETPHFHVPFTQGLLGTSSC